MPFCDDNCLQLIIVLYQLHIHELLIIVTILLATDNSIIIQYANVFLGDNVPSCTGQFVFW